MPCLGFNCKKGNVPFDKCLAECHDTDRCMSKRTASVFQWFSRRVPDGRSITQLNMPTRMMAMIIRLPFYETPESFVDRSLGSMGHQRMNFDVMDCLTEERLPWVSEVGDELSGQFDSYEDGNLYDLKVAGAYKLKLLEDGKPLAIHDWVKQLNFYRMLLENLGLPVKNMFIEVFVKDTRGIIKRWGVTKKPIITIPWVSDHWMRKYVDIKHDKLLKALHDGYAPHCRWVYCWGGKLCELCSVRYWCDNMIHEWRHW